MTASASSTPVAIRIRDLRKSFSSLEVLKGISIDAHEGEVISILGSSGSGKSTLLRCIFDAIMAGMSATEKRKEAIDFSISYGSTGQAFAAVKGSDLENLPLKGELFLLATNEAGARKAAEDLKPLLEGKTIGVQTALIAARFVDEYLKDAVAVREYKTTEQHDLDLVAGRVDLVMASMGYLMTAVEKPGNADMAIVGPRFQGGMLGAGSSVGLRKSDPELKALFDDAITAAKADGTIKRLSEKWFGFDLTPQ